MITDENIIELFFARSEQGIRELDTKYGKDCHNLSYHMAASAIPSFRMDSFFKDLLLCLQWVQVKSVFQHFDGKLSELDPVTQILA